MKIFFDLDGTLLNSMDRLYRLFQHLVPASVLTYDEYWNLKRNKIGHEEILKNHFFYSDDQIELFKNEWLGLVEAPEWLSMDKPFEGVTAYLAEIKKAHEIYLITARQFEDRLFSQITGYGWHELFTKVFVTGGKRDKYELISESMETGPDDWFIGDTGKDIRTGKDLGMRTAAVLSGFLSKEKLQEYHPDIIINNITDFVSDINKFG